MRNTVPVRIARLGLKRRAILEKDRHGYLVGEDRSKRANADRTGSKGTSRLNVGPSAVRSSWNPILIWINALALNCDIYAFVHSRLVRGGEKDMHVKAWLGILALGLWPTFAQATDETNFSLKTTEDIYTVCSTKSGDPLYREAINFCEGFLLGVVSYHDAVTERQNLQRLICYPATVTRDDGVRAFIEWASNLQSDRKFMSDPPVIGMVRGLASKWPCKQG